MNIINTYADIPSAFDAGHFSMEKWERYLDKWLPGTKEICLADSQNAMRAGCSWETDILPTLDAVMKHPAECEEIVRSFKAVTEHLEEAINRAFHRTVHADIVLYLGLCNGAGWVTDIGGRPTVLLGIEKIRALGWRGIGDMTGLIVHELGHIYHSEYGSRCAKTETPQDDFIWQLFTEGVAMVFEQTVVGDDNYFHQNKNGWKDWCDEHELWLKRSFCEDLKTMTRETQRYFGDLVNFEGYADTGYYLGASFVRYLLRSDTLDAVIRYNFETVKEKFGAYVVSE